MSQFFAILIGKAGISYHCLPHTYYFDSDGLHYVTGLFFPQKGLI